MPRFKERRGFFYHPMPRLRKRAPLIERQTTREIDGERREGRSLIIRLWPTTRAFAIGRWTGLSRLSEDETLLAALQSCPGQIVTDKPTWCPRCGRTYCTCDQHEHDDTW